MTRLQLNQVYTEESKLLKDAMAWLTPQERDGVKVLRICDRYNKGYSDLFLCVRGIFVVVELKTDIGKAMPHQLLFINEMKSCGAIGGVCRRLVDIERLVEKAKEMAHGIYNKED